MERGLSVLLDVATTQKAEIAAYRRWAERRLINAAMVVNLTVGDRRCCASWNCAPAVTSCDHIASAGGRQVIAIS